jgi:hypothetical protein
VDFLKAEHIRPGEKVPQNLKPPTNSDSCISRCTSKQCGSVPSGDADAGEDWLRELWSAEGRRPRIRKLRILILHACGFVGVLRILHG